MFLLALAITLILSLGSPLVAQGQDSLARAKELYSSASYDEALTMLVGLQAGSSGSIATELSQYRAFCLLALQRTDDAKKVIEGMVNADPLYRLSDAQASPRVHTIFRDVRRATLPAVMQRFYAEAKEAFDRKDPRAPAQFEQVLALLDDPDMRDTTSTDFRVLVVGFRDLSRAMASAVVPPPSAAPTTAAGTAAPSASPVVAPARPVVVNPPVALSQSMPRWVPATSTDARQVFTGRLEIAIDERGNVVSAVLTAPIYPSYDDELLSAARRWKFRPATRNGVPIPFVKVIPIQLQQRP